MIIKVNMVVISSQVLIIISTQLLGFFCFVLCVCVCVCVCVCFVYFFCYFSVVNKTLFAYMFYLLYFFT